MSIPYYLWYYNNTVISAFGYYVKPTLMQIINKYGYKVGITMLAAARNDIMYPVTIYRAFYG